MVGLGDEVGNATSYLSRAFGFGDYTVKSNSFQDYGNIAQFKNHGTITFSHREFVSDINSTTGFNNQSYPINPGNSTLFPWLSTIAKNFEQYEFLGLIFEFKSTSATAVGSVNTGLGTVIMATDYDVLDSKYGDKRAMEVSEFSTSAAPYQSQIHPIECDPKQNVMKQLFIQPGNSVSAYVDDPRFSALGNFQIATSGMQAVSTIGELWVSYHVRLLKPQLESGESISSTSMKINAFVGVSGATPGITRFATTNPGAFTVTAETSPTRIVVTCNTIAAVGTYLMTYSIIANSGATNPTWNASAQTCGNGGGASFPLVATGATDIYNTRSMYYTTISTTAATTTGGYDYNPQDFSVVATFSAPGSFVYFPCPYSTAIANYVTLFVAPWNITALNTVTENKVTKPEVEELREMIMQLKQDQKKSDLQWEDLKKEIADTETDNGYEVTVDSNDVARLVDRLASVNLIKNTSSEIDDALKNTVDMLGKNLSLSDRIRLEHYYTNLKKYHL